MTYPALTRRRHPFTLVEVLVVLVITGILLLIGLPAFEKLAKGQGTELASREMIGKLKAVRAYAVTQRKYIALIMPNDQLPDDFRYNSYRACVVSGGAFQYWVPNETWQRLPTGVAFRGVSTSNVPNPAVPDFAQAETIAGVDNTDIGHGTQELAGIIFKPSGQVTKSAKTYVHLGEGKFSGGSLVITNPDPNAHVTVTIDQFTGRVSYGKD